MKTIPIILFILASTMVHAQKNDFKINTEVDEFTGDTTIRSSFFVFNDGYGYPAKLEFGFSTAKDITYLIAVLHIDDLSTISIGDELIFKMADNSIVTVSSLLDEIGNYKDGKYRSIVVYGLSEEQFLSLGASPITKVRIETSQRNYDIEPSGKKPAPACMANFATYYNSVVKN